MSADAIQTHKASTSVLTERGAAMMNGEPVSVWGHSPTRGGKDEWVRVNASSMMDRALLDVIADLMMDRDMHTFTIFSHMDEQESLYVSGSWLLNPLHFGDDESTRAIAYGLILAAMDRDRLI